MILLSLLFSLSLPGSSSAAEGFRASAEKNVMMLKGRFNGATAFLLKTSTHGQVLVTQKHVLDPGDLTIQRGNAVGLLFRLKVVEPGAFQRAFVPEKIWESPELDLTVLKPAFDLTALCKCEGLLPSSFTSGPASLVGYPITELRIYPRTSRLFSLWRQLGQDVRQQRSEGAVYAEENGFFGDMDALPGNSGGPILDRNGNVMGIIHAQMAKEEEGYRYKSPSRPDPDSSRFKWSFGRRQEINIIYICFFRERPPLIPRFSLFWRFPEMGLGEKNKSM